MIALANDARRSAIPKLIISESGSFPDLAVFYLAEVIGPALQQLAGLVRRGVENGQFRKVDPELVRQKHRRADAAVGDLAPHLRPL